MKRPMTVASAPKSTVNSKAITMYAGIETMGFPPTTRGQSIDVHVVKANPVAVPVNAPTSVHTRTGLCP